jgi:NodT family efflux transporter outer membrane factor (OMF) lipoprotein
MASLSMPDLQPRNVRLPRLLAPMPLMLAALALAGCSAVGPDFVKPVPATPDDWTSWRSADESLRQPPGAGLPVPTPWWTAFHDPLLDRLQQEALAASPDLYTAALRFAQARVQRGVADAQRGPELGLAAGLSQQRQSEYGASTRMFDVIGGNRQALAKFLSQPFTLHQAGFDASWEPDLWGRVRRSLEAADADLGSQAALADLARLSVTSDLARAYADLRTTQRLLELAREDVSALRERLDIVQARVRGGAVDSLDLERRRAELAALQAQPPGLLAQEGALVNQIGLLLDKPPGALREVLAATANSARPALPDLALGLPSEVALRRPDIRAAEARLHRATANIGVARAALYPSIRLGARLGFESYLSGEFADWGGRAWSVGPSLNLPLFDHGRRQRVVQLRELEQQEAAVAYHQTVRKAWQDIDDALSAYAAEQQQARALEARMASVANAFELTQARYRGGSTDYTAVLDGRRGLLQARRDLWASEGRLATRFVAVNKALGNGPRGEARSAD